MGGSAGKEPCVAPNVCKERWEKGKKYREKKQILRDVLEVGIELLAERRVVLWIEHKAHCSHRRREKLLEKSESR